MLIKVVFIGLALLFCKPQDSFEAQNKGPVVYGASQEFLPSLLKELVKNDGGFITVKHLSNFKNIRPIVTIDLGGTKKRNEELLVAMESCSDVTCVNFVNSIYRKSDIRKYRRVYFAGSRHTWLLLKTTLLKGGSSFSKDGFLEDFKFHTGLNIRIPQDITVDYTVSFENDITMLDAVRHFARSHGLVVEYTPIGIELSKKQANERGEQKGEGKQKGTQFID